MRLLKNTIKTMIDKKIAVAGCGYVGLSLATMLSQKVKVTAYDTDRQKIEKINKRISPIDDREIKEFFATKELNLIGVDNAQEAFGEADYCIIAVPTNYDPETNVLDVSVVEDTIRKIRDINEKALVIIKSTVPIGFTKGYRDKTGDERILFSPEFLRESKALYDNLYPSRIIAGIDSVDPEILEKTREFLSLISSCVLKKDVPILIMGSAEAESVKLFSNTYLALRVAFFNELDTFADMNGMDTSRIIEGVCADPRIGDHYNNPSFGFGGYCLPKDTKQLSANYSDIPADLIHAVVKSNKTRKEYIADAIYKKALSLVLESEKNDRIKDGNREVVIGIYKLIMKSGSDNFRESSIIGVIDRLVSLGANVIIHEPLLGEESEFHGCDVINDFGLFEKKSSLIVTNRYDSKLDYIKEKVFTRDVYKRD